jgi:hypothetical protein
MPHFMLKGVVKNDEVPFLPLPKKKNVKPSD